MADKKREPNATTAGEGPADASAGSGSSGPEDSVPTTGYQQVPTRGSGRGESSGIVETTPTTAEEAMDRAAAEDGFVDESAYAPTDR